MGSDPFAVLGLSADAGADDVRAARRRLAREHHPDRGGEPERMRAINEAADAAMAAVARRQPTPVRRDESRRDQSAPRLIAEDEGPGWARDVPSFTVEALPAETFEALLVVVADIGEVLDDDPPYRLDCHLREPFDCWCRLDVLPDAGSSTVSLTIAGVDDQPTPSTVAVRDTWIAHLNALDWPA